ncbi:MAG: ArsC family reductase [Sphingopyxis sp.]|nr:ArsC family reductase [Sphingopyxis sp.]
MITIHGIPNCDTVKKARKWLDGAGIAHHFHDVRKDGLNASRLNDWIAALGWESLLNRNGTTFRKLPDPAKADLDAAKAAALMLAEPAMIKRPVVEYPGGLMVGFKEGDWAARLL